MPLRSGGHLAFETRNSAKRAWESWNDQHTRRRIVVEGLGPVDTWTEFLSVSLPFVSFRHTFHFTAGSTTLSSDSTLRFREQHEIREA